MRSLLPWRRQEENEWQPFRELEEWHRNVDDLFSRFMARTPFAVGSGRTRARGRPSMETLTKNGDLVVRLDLPGVHPKEVDISVSGDVLTVKAERKYKEEKKREGKRSHEEIAYGSLERSLEFRKDRCQQDQGELRQRRSRDHHAGAGRARSQEGLRQGRGEKLSRAVRMVRP